MLLAGRERFQFPIKRMFMFSAILPAEPQPWAIGSLAVTSTRNPFGGKWRPVLRNMADSLTAICEQTVQETWESTSLYFERIILKKLYASSD
jgi:hypothetical protein